MKQATFTKTELDRLLRRNPHLIARELRREEPKPLPAAAPVVTDEDRMSQAELEMNAILGSQLRRGEITWFGFEAITLRVGVPRCKYTPDFSIMPSNPRPRLKFIEVKGAKKWEDSLVKYKSAQLQFPMFDFEMWECRKGNWKQILTFPKTK